MDDTASNKIRVHLDAFRNYWRLAGFIGAALGLLFVLYVYFWYSYHANGVKLDPDHRSYYRLLSDALLSGQLHLLPKPDPALLALKDPYDPVSNHPYRMHDASLYHGKWYLYFGITPALLMGIPLRLMNLEVCDDFCAPIFCWVAFIAGLAFLNVITRASDLKPKIWMWILAALALAFSQCVPYMLCRCLIYETAIASGYCCTMLALYFLSSGCLLEKISNRRLAAGSLFLALAVGGRPNYVLNVWILIPLTLQILRQISPSLKNERIKALIALWLPCIAFGFCLGLYNFLRFDSWTEFGQHYQLASVDGRILRTFNWENVKPNFYYYIWDPLTFNKEFPYFHTTLYYPASPPLGYMVEAATGILSLTPLVYLLGLLPTFRDPSSGVLKREWSVLNVSIAILIALGIVQLTAISLALPSCTMRYMLDFAPLILLATLLVWFALDRKLSAGDSYWARFCLNGFAAVAIGYGCMVNLAIAMSGYNDSFRAENPQTYLSVQHTIEDYVIGHPYAKVDPSEYLLTVIFSRLRPRNQMREPLLVRGAEDSADILAVEYLDDKRLRFVWSQGALAPVASQPFEAITGKVLRVSVRTEKEIEVLVDGTPVLQLNQKLLAGKNPFIYYGECPFGSGVGVSRHFSGAIMNAVER